MSMEVVVKPKKWGNSLGMIIPREVVAEQKITLKDDLIVHIKKKIGKEKSNLMKEGYLEMKEELKKMNEDWESADYEG